MAMAMDAKRGIYDPSTVDEDRRYWLARVRLIDSSNAEEFMAEIQGGNPTIDYSDYFGDKYIGGAAVIR
jgi:hypothetical protein